ncbi:hypothetical protein E4U41_006277 [Claviceps citrina]|nr:hypothetical protein E4U41_006277 [Claviceps citrina]
MSILVSPDREHLVAMGLATEPTPVGFIRVHRRLLTDNPDGEFPDLPLASHRTVRTCFQSQFFDTIPERLMSRACLEYLGLTPERADIIWRRWEAGPGGDVPCPSDHHPYGDFFVDWVIKELCGPCHSQPRFYCWHTKREWHRRMTAYGLNVETQLEVVAEGRRCEEMRLSELARLTNVFLNPSTYWCITEDLGQACADINSTYLLSCDVLVEHLIRIRFWYLQRATHLSKERANNLRVPGLGTAMPSWPTHCHRFYPGQSTGVGQYPQKENKQDKSPEMPSTTVINNPHREGHDDLYGAGSAA